MFLITSALFFAMSAASYLNIGDVVFLSSLTFLIISFTINSASSAPNLLPLALALLIKISATSFITSLEVAFSTKALTPPCSNILYSEFNVFLILSFIKAVNSLVATFKFLPSTTVFKN